MIYRKEFAGEFVRVIADDGERSREIASCRAGDIPRAERWPQAVKDAELIVDALNAYTDRQNGT